MRGPRRILATVVAAVAAAAACGVPTDEEARTLGTPPFGLLTTSTTVAPTTVPADEGFSLRPYWVTPDDQVAPGEPLGLPEAPTFQQVLNLLAEGPPVPEQPAGGTTTTTTVAGEAPPPPPLRTFITEALHPQTEGDEVAVGPVVTNVANGVLDILVADQFRDEAAQQPTRFRLAIAQVVCTVTQFDNVGAVRFFDSRGQLTLVNLDAITIEVATRDNIGQCDPPDPSTTTAAPSTTTTPRRVVPNPTTSTTAPSAPPP